jgi:predicted peptidase
VREVVSHPTNKEQLWVSPQYAKIIKKIAVDVGKRYSDVADEVLDLGLKEYAKKYNIDLEKYK